MACELDQWREACAEVDTATQDDFDDFQQSLIDFRWELLTKKLLSVFRVAYYLALLELPDEVEDKDEMYTVCHLASRLQTGRTKTQRARRQFPVEKRPVPMRIRKMRNKLGRALELRRSLASARIDHKTYKMNWKLFGTDRLVKDEQLSDLISSLENVLKEFEATEKLNAINKWKTRMRHDCSARAMWVTRKKACIFPPPA